MRTATHFAPKIPKIREYAEIQLSDGSILTGYVFVEATARIQDLLNDSAPFMPFVEEDGTVHLLNKSAIVKVRPFD